MNFDTTRDTANSWEVGTADNYQLIANCRTGGRQLLPIVYCPSTLNYVGKRWVHRQTYDMPVQIIVYF